MHCSHLTPKNNASASASEIMIRKFPLAPSWVPWEALGTLHYITLNQKPHTYYLLMGGRKHFRFLGAEETTPNYHPLLATSN